MAFDRLKAAARILASKDFDPTQGVWLPVRQDGSGNFVSSYYHDDDSFENSYGNMTAISKAGRVVQPFLVDGNGEQVKAGASGKQLKAAQNVLAKVYSPNEDMSDEEFFEALILMYLAKSRFYVRIHHTARRNNGTIDPASITGFTFLENAQPRIEQGVRYYQVGTKKYDAIEVMSFGGINPLDLSEGYSPLQAARRWTRIEDYMADYQAGFFANGAVASGMYTIAAETEQQYLDIKTMMQKTQRGAKKNNNVLYNYSPVDPTTGKPGQAQITWTPFTVQNKDLALKDLHEIVNKKQNDSFGVSGVIKGDVDETTYASAMVVEKFFVKYTVKPIVSSIWRRFTHEINRATGGLDYAFSFELEVPVLGDELIQRAEAKKTDAETLTMLAKRYTLKSIVEAFDFPESYKKLKPIEQAPAATTTPDPVQPDAGADAPGDNNGAPSQEAGAKTTTKAITPDERKSYEDQLRDELQAYTDADINSLVEAFIETGTVPDAPGELDDKLEAILTATVIAILVQRGQREQAAAISTALKAGVKVPGLSAYVASPEQLAEYKTYLQSIATGYNAQTRSQVLSAITDALREGTNKNDLAIALQKIGLSEYRARRLADSEINRASNNASLDAHKRVSDAMTDHYYVKVWVADGPAPCPTCSALDGTNMPLDKAFIDLGQTFNDENGDPVTNSFMDIETADAHPNCQCHQRYELRSY